MLLLTRSHNLNAHTLRRLFSSADSEHNCFHSVLTNRGFGTYHRVFSSKSYLIFSLHKIVHTSSYLLTRISSHFSFPNLNSRFVDCVCQHGFVDKQTFLLCLSLILITSIDFTCRLLSFSACLHAFCSSFRALQTCLCTVSEKAEELSVSAAI